MRCECAVENAHARIRPFGERYVNVAIMFPERLPADVESDAERRLFEEFRQTFSDDFTVFAQVAWLSKQRGKGAFDGEADPA